MELFGVEVGPVDDVGVVDVGVADDVGVTADAEAVEEGPQVLVTPMLHWLL